MKNIVSSIKKQLVNKVPDRIYLKRKYRIVFGEKLNLSNPKKLSEKIQWLKLYDRNPLYIELVDKYSVKDYIRKKIGLEYIIPTLGVWDHFEDIDFNRLPNQFVLKGNHDSGTVLICENKEKFDYKKAQQFFSTAMKNNYYYGEREWIYKNIRPRIIAEKYIEENGTQPKHDYKMYCFNGEPKLLMIKTITNFDTMDANYDFFDMDRNYIPIDPVENENNYIPSIPDRIEEMVDISAVLSKDIPFVRIDFYVIDSTIYFGEMTFYPDAGFDNEIDPYWDRWLGDLLEIDLNKKCR